MGWAHRTEDLSPPKRPFTHCEGITISRMYGDDSMARTVYQDEDGNHLGCPPAPSKLRGQLGDICPTVIDLEVIRSFAGASSDIHHLLDMCQNLQAWEPHMFCLFDDIPHAFSRGTSRRMLKHMARMTVCGVVRTINLRDIKCVTNFFTVDKKDLSLRLVVDGRKVNMLMERPPNMELPTLESIVDYVMSNRFATQCDGKSWFYQVPISEEVGTMFCANLAGTRGEFVSVALTRLPMGWSYAPAIAQRISNALLKTEDGRILGMAWLDNFIFAGKTEEEVSANFREFLERCKKANAKVDEENPTPNDVMCALGIEFNMALGTYRLDPEWILKKTAMSPTKSMTPRSLYEMTGTMIWHDFVKRIPLCHQEANIELIRRVAKLMAGSPAWDELIAVRQHEVEGLDRWLQDLRHNAPKKWTPAVIPQLDLWSDASDNEWAALLLQGDELVAGEQGVFVGGPRGWHIFIKEAFAADKVLQATKGVPRKINIDNQPLVHCINRGFSANRMVNALIRTWDLENIRAVWVPTTKELADPFTRGVMIPPTVAQLSTEKKSLTAPLGPDTHNLCPDEKQLLPFNRTFLEGLLGTKKSLSLKNNNAWLLPGIISSPRLYGKTLTDTNGAEGRYESM